MALRALVVTVVSLSLSALATAAPASAAPAAFAPAAFHYSAAVAPTRTVHLHGISGSIQAAPADDAKVDVQAVVHHGDPALVRIVTNEDVGGIAICVLYVDEPVDACRSSGVEHRASHDRDIDVDLVARIPRGGSLDAVMLNGAIHARVIDGEVRATTLNGSVTVQAARVREATTLNGSVDATLDAPPAPGHLAFTTANGSVRIALPAGTDAVVSATTAHGSIRANFPIQVDKTGPGGPESARARLGKGGARIEVTTTNGSVDVHQGA